MTIPRNLDLHLPYITDGLPGIGGVLRSTPELFRVEEVPAYDPIGYGDHIFLNVTKSLRTTRDTQIELAKLFDLQREEVGHAGLKDKYAVTTQTFSLLMPKTDPSDIAKAVESNLGITVNWFSRHPKKLRSGHLKGNKFWITVTDIESIRTALETAELIRERINGVGLPNFYGVQRIGVKGDNVRQGYDIIKGFYKEYNRWLRRYLVSSYLSYICNIYITERIKRGSFTQLLSGDLAKKHETGGVFTVEDLSVEQPRSESKEISFTAPIFGFKMRETKCEAKKFEDEIFSLSDLTLEDLRRCGATGTRRMGRLFPEMQLQEDPEGLTIVFTLPAGGYATVLLREFMKTEEISIAADEPDIEVEET
ncbi:MAG: tRNA pseudouridine(13) synthase TruD [Candidatus Bathyarchaeota archaeon]|nr:tRNA pseudouridine(13) synthase TruD [Candidatus Bathyarchaeota archaeon]